MPDSEDEQELSREAAERAAAAARASERSMRIDLQTLQSMRRTGQPSRARVRPVAPVRALRKEDAELEDALDHLTDEADVRRHVEEFNDRVTEADSPENPSLTTLPRDVDATVAAWRERYDAFQAVPRAVPQTEPDAAPPKRHWWNRRNRR